jgi:4-hydroxybenzoyl-CoA reductase subunit beta
MLRLPKFRVEYPTTIDQAVALMAEYGERAMLLAGGTDLIPNMKHKLFEPEVVVALGGVENLSGICPNDDGSLHIGAITTLADVASSAKVLKHAPALASAAGIVAGPQLRNMGTLGGNVMLDTRCQWYNQTHFWREALGFCLKKDGSLCHVIAGGSKCVAAASNDTAPALMTLNAELRFISPRGETVMPIVDLWSSDGIWNKKVARDDLLVAIKIPPQAEGHRGSYVKLRERNSIDFPQLGVAARIDFKTDGSIAEAALAVTALGPRPVQVKAATLLVETMPGTKDFDRTLDELCAKAHKQMTPLANIPGDETYRKRMLPVFIRRAISALVD